MHLLIRFMALIFSVIGANGHTLSTYNNPVIEKSLPDPAVVSDGEGNYYIYSTNASKKTPIYRSSDLVKWTYCSDAFTPEQMPKGLPKGAIWAPDVIKYDGQYVMAYSYSQWGEVKKNGIGIAVAESPKGPFMNQGMLFTSEECGVDNSIDPAFFIEKGRLYLLWGSFRGVYIVELNKDKKGRFYIQDIDAKQKIAGNAFEGSHIFKRGKYYYLFASVGKCCQQDNSTYRVVVGRSKNLFGPYVDSSGNGMLDNGYDFVLGPNDKFVGTGHGSTIITDKDGKTWYIYHAYERGQGKKGRMVLLDEIKWDKEGWPYVYKGEPSTGKVVAPKF